MIAAYDRSSNTLSSSGTQSGSITLGTNSSRVKWSPDGEFILLGVDDVASTGNVYIFEILSFPSNNIIKGNTVYCNSGGSIPSGVGISGSSIANMIIQNNAYSNPLHHAAYEPMVGSNYIFVTNVFNQYFQNQPTLLQNISIDDSQAICMPFDEVLLAKQFCAKAQDLGLCSPIAIIAGTTITSAGRYCLARDIVGDISITNTCITLDLNNRCLTGIISLDAVYDTHIFNGFITPPTPASTPSPAINIASTCNRVTV